MMDWSPELKQFRNKFQAIGDRYRDSAHQAWGNRNFPYELWNVLAGERLFGLVTSKEYGYKEGMTRLAAALEGLTHGLAGSGFAIAVVSHVALSLTTIDRYANAEIKDKYIDLLVSGKGIAAFAITEDHGGSEALNSHCTLSSREDGGYILNGAKWHITNAPDASVIITFAQNQDTGEITALLLDRSWPGVEIQQPLKPVGFRNAPVSAIKFHEVRVPATHILGRPTQGRTILREAFLLERIITPFPGVGALDYLLGKLLDYTQVRKLSGQSIGDFQYIQRRLTDIKIDLDSIQALSHNTLHKFVEAQDVSLEASMIKMMVARAVMTASTHAIQIYGSRCIVEEEYPDMILLDSLAATIAGGTEEIHRNVIYQQLTRRHRRTQRKSR